MFVCVIILFIFVEFFEIAFFFCQPEITHCRNKDEFVVGRGVSGGSKTVGFLTGPPRLPSSFCVPPTHLPHIREAHKLFAKVRERKEVRERKGKGEGKKRSMFDFV